ncbi:hypothetical protein ACS0PU_009141 [Formica fusca]
MTLTDVKLSHTETECRRHVRHLPRQLACRTINAKVEHRAGKKKCILRFAAAALDERTFSSNGRVIVCRAEISLEEFAAVCGVGFP